MNAVGTRMDLGTWGRTAATAGSLANPPSTIRPDFASVVRQDRSATSDRSDTGAATQLRSGQAEAVGPDEVRETFDRFVGQTFFGTLLAQMRKTQDGPEYLSGGRAEEIFRGQLDQVLVERISDATAERISQPMYDLMMLPQR